MDSCCESIVIFGITGDLARKKIFSALYELAAQGDLFDVYGVGRSPWDDRTLRNTAADAIRGAMQGADLDEDVLDDVLARLGYVCGDYRDPKMYDALAASVEGQNEVLCYLAVPPPVFDTVVVGLVGSGLHTKARLLVEKPFGSDATTSRKLTALMDAHFLADQVFAVDHYLHKESLQNISVLRFANRVFEPVWNVANIEAVAITMTERFGIGDRAGFFDQTGTLRDVVHSHGLQIVAAVGMEPPESSDPDSVDQRRSELLAAVRPLQLDDVVFGQYAGYRSIEGVDSESNTDTFVHARLTIDNDRWRDVLWTLTAGKALKETCTEINVTFRPTGTASFISEDCEPEQNHLKLRLSPTESIALLLQTRSATVPLGTTPAELVSEQTYRNRPDTGAYARLFMDAAKGDHTQFASMRVVELSWRIVEQLLHRSCKPLEYEQGSSGPADYAIATASSQPTIQPRNTSEQAS